LKRDKKFGKLILPDVENLHHAYIRTSSSERFKVDQSTSAHIWSKIVHVHPSQSSQRVSKELPLHKLNLIDVQANKAAMIITRTQDLSA
jgi:hypothetical protein